MLLLKATCEVIHDLKRAPFIFSSQLDDHETFSRQYFSTGWMMIS